MSRKPILTLTVCMFEKIADSKKRNIIARLEICGDRCEIRKVYEYDEFFNDDHREINEKHKPKFDFWITKGDRMNYLAIKCDKIAKKFRLLIIDRSINKKYSIRLKDIPQSDNFVINADHIDVLRYLSTTVHIKARSIGIVYIECTLTDVNNVICPNINSVFHIHCPEIHMINLKRIMEGNYEKIKPIEKPLSLISAFFAMHHERATIKRIQQ